MVTPGICGATSAATAAIFMLVTSSRAPQSLMM